MTSGIASAQSEALKILAPELPEGTYLAGGVAVALHLSHRQSRDLDLFVAHHDLSQLPARVAGMSEVIITSRGPGVVNLTVAKIPVTILRHDYPLLLPAQPAAEIPIPVADPLDLACMKLSAIASRGARRDFWDLHALLARDGAPSLGDLLAAFSRKYSTEDVGHVVKSLVYFADAETEPFPIGLEQAHWDAIKADLVARVREL